MRRMEDVLETDVRLNATGADGANAIIVVGIATTIMKAMVKTENVFILN